jgi:asparagine synthase (glutamine-hydrolysing)
MNVCGFVGFINSSSSMDRETLTSLVEKMTAPIFQRGPDDLGIQVEPASGLAFGFRRLSILDLSPEGHQPMTSRNGRYTMVFNGEIYNYQEIRDEMLARGQAFRGHSDTEVLLAAFTEWGPAATIAQCNGMFAIALWDRQEDRLHLFRDRVGKKPLYYGWQGRTFLFGSQLSALKVHPDFKAAVDRDALALYMRHNAVPDPHSIYEGIRKLMPGCGLTLDPRRPGYLEAPQPFWSSRQALVDGVANPWASEEEGIEELHRLLLNATSRRMVADVPVGAFLSGGIDSSLVVALMQASCDRPVRTFTIGFDETGFNEAPYAKAVAAHLGTDHTEVYLSGQDALEVVPNLPRIFDEPFSDSSQIPTWLVSQVARQQVTVALSGDGGDELFAGYPHQHTALRVWKRLNSIPGPLRWALGTVAGCLLLASPQGWNRVLNKVNIHSPEYPDGRFTGDLLHRVARVLKVHTLQGMYRVLRTHWEGTDIVLGSKDAWSPFLDPATLPPGISPLTSLQYLDSITYLLNDILVKVDRASMAVSLEARAPLLDYRVLEQAWRFRDEWKYRRGVGKLPLRRILSRYIPDSLIDRPKMGFGIPLGDWLRGPLRPWAEELLSRARLEKDGFFRPGPIRAEWKDHLKGFRDHHSHLWDVLMFNAWLETR